MEPPSFSRSLSLMFGREFEYDPAKALSKGNIRLVTLHPGKTSTVIKCQLFVKSLSENPVYEALSYQWGGAEGREWTILLDGKRHNVRYNLLLALIHLRHLDTKRTFWIDAICINQGDKIEKSVQIEQMGRVYSQALRVVVWLGRGNDDSRMSLPFLRRLAEEDLHDETITSIFEEKKITNLGIRLDLSLRQTLNGNRYWYRLWIIQEIFLARDAILCFGHGSISWNTLGRSLQRLRRYLDALPPEPSQKAHLTIFDLGMAVRYGGAAKLQLMNSMQHALDNSPNILRRLLGLAQRAESFKWQDKIYGLLGMTDFNMPVDYDKTAFELYSDAMLSFRNALSQSPLDDCEIYTVKLSQILQNLLNGPYPKESSNRTVSCVKMIGVLSGEICQIDDGYEGPRNPKTNNIPSREDEEEDISLRLRRILHLNEESTGCKLGKQNERLILDLVNSPTRHLISGCFPQYFRGNKRQSSAEPVIPVLASVPRTGSVPIYDEKVCPWVRRRQEVKLFVSSPLKSSSLSSESAVDITSNYLIGLVSPEAQAGDKIVRFLESEFCLVVRNTGSSEYKYVGCACIPETGDPCFDSDTLGETSMIDCLPVMGSAPSYAQLQLAFQGTTGCAIDIVMDVEALQFLTRVKY